MGTGMNGFLVRNGIGAPKRKKAEDSPGWDARNDGNRTGNYQGQWYENGKRKNRNQGRMPIRPAPSNQGRMRIP